MIAIVKYNAGNTRSVQNTLNRLGYNCIVTDDPDELRRANKVIFPGVGEASTAMQYLKERKLDQVITSLTQPFLGICLGLQLMCDYTEEGNTTCLGIFNTQVKKFSPKDIVPHMGWNNFKSINGDLLNNVNTNNDVYYVHSYYAIPNENTIATCDYIVEFGSVFQKDNFNGMQFHPEKSAMVGEQLLKNFLAL